MKKKIASDESILDANPGGSLAADDLIDAAPDACNSTPSELDTYSADMPPLDATCFINRHGGLRPDNCSIYWVECGEFECGHYADGSVIIPGGGRELTTRHYIDGARVVHVEEVEYQGVAYNRVWLSPEMQAQEAE